MGTNKYRQGRFYYTYSSVCWYACHHRSIQWDDSRTGQYGGSYLYQEEDYLTNTPSYAEFNMNDRSLNGSLFVILSIRSGW